MKTNLYTVIISLLILSLFNPVISQELLEEYPEEKMEEPKKEPKEEGFQDLQKEEKFEIKIDDSGLIPIPKNNDEGMKFYKEKFIQEYDVYFEDAWNAVKTVFDEMGIFLMNEVQKQDDEGFFKGIIKTEYSVFVNDKSKAVPELKRYSYDMPYIRGAVWINGRSQYTVVINEIDDGERVSILVRCEISGREDNVTNEVHFWKSNGYLETNLYKRIEKKLNL